jgi:DNA-binding CsgD family transcriptional regulator/exonuclease VII small subunit
MEGGPVHGILGRDAELAEVQSFVGSASGGLSALLLEGTAGIGKTTLWRAGVSFARARGHRVLSCRAAEAEARLSYAALGDLFDFELPDLPAPQRRALDAALLREEVEGAPPDQRAVSLASLGVLRALAASAPVIIAIDDLQWLDAPSARVLAFVVRRLEDAPIRILVALRVGSGGDPLALGRAGPVPSLHRVSIGPLREEAMTRLLRARTGGDLTHPILLRLHRISEGNPFFALEIARALTGQGVRPAPGEPMPVPEDLQALLGIRLAALPSSAADGLLVVAAAARPTELLVVAAAGSNRASTGITRAEEAGILQRAGGRIGFTHPLLGSTVYAAATPQARRSVHRRLAGLVVDPEERARHLALAASGPHRQVARALEEAGRHARQGGAPDAAAELLELARRLTPPEDSAGLLRRSVEAAEYHFDAGDATRATALLQEAIATARPGRDRARIRLRLASISWLDMPRVQGLSEQALQEAGEDAGTRTALLEHMAWVGIYRGDLAFAAERARASQQWARRTTHPAIRAESLSTFAMVEFLLGRPAQDLMTEAVRLEDLAMREAPGSQATVFTASRTCHGLQLLWAGELDAAREVLHQELAEYESLGRYVVRDELLTYLAEVECRAGNWDVAARHAQEAYEIDVESGWVLGLGHLLFPRALVAALNGDVDTARSDAEEGLRQSLRNEDMLDASCNRAVLGFLELSLSNPGAAMERLEPVLAFLEEMGSPEPGVIPCVPDAVEALVSLGRLDEAERLVDRLERQGRTLDRPWAIATAGRGRGLLTAARGDLSAARSALEQALVEHRRVPQPFELARTLLVKGEVERRARQKRAARSTLEQALGLFQALGAPFWAQRARDDLARVGGAAPASSELTPTEQRIAQLVGEGKKNREVADALFISVKTVEANLSRIFHKLGVRSRTELTRRIAAIHRVSPDSSPPREG